MTLFHHKYGILEMSNEHSSTWENYSTGMRFGAFFTVTNTYVCLPLDEVIITAFL